MNLLWNYSLRYLVVNGRGVRFNRLRKGFKSGKEFLCRAMAWEISTGLPDEKRLNDFGIEI